MNLVVHHSEGFTGGCGKNNQHLQHGDAWWAVGWLEPFDAHGLSLIHPISPEHLYANHCFRPLECHVKQCTVPAVLELIFYLKRWSKPVNEKPHDTHHTEIRIQKIKECKGLGQGFSASALLTFGYLIHCWTDSLILFCVWWDDEQNSWPLPTGCQDHPPLIAPTKNALRSCQMSSEEQKFSHWKSLGGMESDWGRWVLCPVENLREISAGTFPGPTIANYLIS